MYGEDSQIEVYISPFDDVDNKYWEFKAPPNLSSPNISQNERYIGAVTGERFAITVILHPDFDFKGHSHVKVKTEIDGGSLFYSDCLKKQRGKGRTYRLDSSSMTYWQNRELKADGFVFGALQSGIANVILFNN